MRSLILKAIETFKSFENKDQKLLGAAATNLSFLYFLDGDFKQAESYAGVAMSHDRYNSKAHTNRGNSYYQEGIFTTFRLILKGNLEKAKEHYEEAISLDAVSTEAMYNLGNLIVKI